MIFVFLLNLVTFFIGIFGASDVKSVDVADASFMRLLIFFASGSISLSMRRAISSLCLCVDFATEGFVLGTKVLDVGTGAANLSTDPLSLVLVIEVVILVDLALPLLGLGSLDGLLRHLSAQPPFASPMKDARIVTRGVYCPYASLNTTNLGQSYETAASSCAGCGTGFEAVRDFRVPYFRGLVNMNLRD